MRLCFALERGIRGVEGAGEVPRVRQWVLACGALKSRRAGDVLRAQCGLIARACNKAFKGRMRDWRERPV